MDILKKYSNAIKVSFNFLPLSLPTLFHVDLCNDICSVNVVMLAYGVV